MKKDKEKKEKKKGRIRNKVLLVLLFIVVFFAAAIGRVQQLGGAPMKLIQKQVKWDDSVDKTYTGLKYENAHGHTYDLYVPDGLDKSKPQYLILFIHGGSFNSGSKADGELYCKYYASQGGYIGASLDYTLQKQGHKDDNLHTMNEEVKNCVTAIYEKCKELGYNVEGMAPCGISAGGTLAMNYAYTCKDTTAIPVKLILNICGPEDFTEPERWGLLKWVNDGATDAEFIQLMTGVKITDEMIKSGEYKKYAAEVSPTQLVTPDAPPMVMAYGAKDHCVPVELRQPLEDALKANNVPYECILFPNSNHGMYRDLDKLQEFLDKSLEYCEKYFAE